MAKRKSNQISNSGNEPDASETDHKTKMAALEKDVAALMSQLNKLEAKYVEIESKCDNLKLENKVLSKKIIEVSQVPQVKVGKTKAASSASSASSSSSSSFPAVVPNLLPSHPLLPPTPNLGSSASSNSLSLNEIYPRKDSKGNWRSKHLDAIDIHTHKILRIFRNQKEAAVKLGISQVSIVECCRGKKPSAGNFLWKVYSGPPIDCKLYLTPSRLNACSFHHLPSVYYS